MQLRPEMIDFLAQLNTRCAELSAMEKGPKQQAAFVRKILEDFFPQLDPHTVEKLIVVVGMFSVQERKRALKELQ